MNILKTSQSSHRSLGRTRIVSLHGAYHGSNFGDLLLIHLFITWIREYDPSIKIHLPTASKTKAASLGADLSGLSSMRKTGALVFCGGGYFGEPPYRRIAWGNRMIRRYISVAKIAKLNDVPIAILGVGVGPVFHPLARKLMVRLFNIARSVAVRDQQSAEYLKLNGVLRPIDVTADCALGMPEVCHGKHEHGFDAAAIAGRKIVGVHLQYPNDYRQHEERVISSLSKLMSTRNDVFYVLFTDVPKKRRPVLAKRLLEQHPTSCTWLDYKTPAQFIPYIPNFDAIVTSKLHIGIVACGLGTPVAALPFHHKTPRFYQQIRRGHWCKPVNSVSANEIEEIVNRAIDHGRSGGIIPPDVRDAAYINKTRLWEFLDTVFSTGKTECA